jgi:hypothetical protein
MRRVVEAFDTLEVRYLIGGSVATMLYGIPRLTRDVDFVAEIRHEHVTPLMARLQDEFYIDDQMISDAIQRQGSFNVIHLATMDKADVFVANSDDWGKLQMDRRQYRHPDPRHPDFGAYFSSPEDNILNKLVWYRLGGGSSSQQWNDILGVLKVQARALDLTYLQAWSDRLAIAELLTTVLHDAGID